MEDDTLSRGLRTDMAGKDSSSIEGSVTEVSSMIDNINTLSRGLRTDMAGKDSSSIEGSVTEVCSMEEYTLSSGLGIDMAGGDSSDIEECFTAVSSKRDNIPPDLSVIICKKLNNATVLAQTVISSINVGKIVQSDSIQEDDSPPVVDTIVNKPICVLFQLYIEHDKSVDKLPFMKVGEYDQNRGRISKVIKFMMELATPPQIEFMDGNKPSVNMKNLDGTFVNNQLGEKVINSKYKEWQETLNAHAFKMQSQVLADLLRRERIQYKAAGKREKTGTKSPSLYAICRRINTCDNIIPKNNDNNSSSGKCKKQDKKRKDSNAEDGGMSIQGAIIPPADHGGSKKKKKVEATKINSYFHSFDNSFDNSTLSTASSSSDSSSSTSEASKLCLRGQGFQGVKDLGVEGVKG
jgi:hypothetical protein